MQIIHPTDHLIMSEEGANGLGDCYISSYHLSDKSTFGTYTNYSSAKHYSGFDNTTQKPLFFHGHTLVNWGIFIKPRHPIFARTLANVIDVLRSEYTRRTVMMITRWDAKWKLVMCSTNFVMTYTIREMLLQNALGGQNTPNDVRYDSKSPAGDGVTDLVPRILVSNFNVYGGRVKAIWTGADQNHYMKVLLLCTI